MQHSKILYEKGIIKNKKMITQSQFSQNLFEGQLFNIKNLYNSLNAINFNDDVHFLIMEDGLRAIVEDAKYVQASVHISKGCFSTYELLRNEEISIRVNLRIICDCLSIFPGADCSMKIIYKGHGAPLIILLEQHNDVNLMIECSIKTKHGDDPVEFSIDTNDKNYNSIILRGPDFHDLMTEINKTTEQLEILISNNEPYFRLQTIGVIQAESTLDVDRCSEMMEVFQCRSTTKTKYQMSHLRMITKALAIALKVSLQTDSSGILAIQMMIVFQEEAQIHVEFFISPLFDDF